MPDSPVVQNQPQDYSMQWNSARVVKFLSQRTVNNATVVTRNLRDFQQVPGPRLADWSMP